MEHFSYKNDKITGKYIFFAVKMQVDAVQKEVGLNTVMVALEWADG